MARRDGGLRKHSTTLFSGVLSGVQRNWAGFLPDHRNLTNHQVCMVASGAPTAGKFSVRIIPDADGVNTAVDTGLVLDLTGKNSAVVSFTGVIRGLQLISIENIAPTQTTISAVVSSFSRYRRSWLGDRVSDQRLDYISSDLFDTQTGFNSKSQHLDNHSNMIYHQISVMADSAIDDQYAVRFLPETDAKLETTVDTDHILDFAGTETALVRFGGVLTGIQIEKISGTSSGVPIKAVFSSSAERFDEVVYQYIGGGDVEDNLNDHLNDFNNPHQTSWDNLLGKPEAFPEWEVVPVGVTVTVPTNKQLLIWETHEIEGTVEVEADGRLVILHDRPETRLREPDFTYNIGGELTQIDYVDGQQKLFTYNSGQLTQVDSKRDGTTLRKTFTYTGGGELDYITETWLDNS